MKSPSLRIACPRCQQPAERNCVAGSGRVALEPHAARRRAAKAAGIHVAPIGPGDGWEPTEEPTGPFTALAVQLRSRRQQLGMSQHELRRRSGVCRKTIHCAERGTVPNAPVLGALLTALGCELVLTEPGEVPALRARIAELEAALEARRLALTGEAVREAQAQNRRYREALDALARQPVITHDLIDDARAAVAGSPTPERTAA